MYTPTPDRTSSAGATRNIEVFSIKGFDNKIAPEDNENKNGSAGKVVGSPVPHAPFSSNGQKTNFDSGIKQDYAWNNYKDIDKLEDNENIPIRYLWSGGTGNLYFCKRTFTDSIKINQLV